MSARAVSASADERPLPLRMRGDLAFSAQTFRGRRFWAVKDPLALKYFHLRDEEYALLTMLDGRTTLEELRRRIEAMFAPRLLSLDELHGFLATLHRHGLVLAASPGQGEQLLARQSEARRRRWIETILGVLAIRLRGVNPRPFLDWLYPKCRFLFVPAFAVFALAMALAALLLVAVRFDTFQARLPELETITSASNLPWLVVVLAVTKILHELGHALACRHFGGDCHEIGIMLLVFTPCLYCNVSDSWMIPAKWRRIAVAAAGMYVEVILASLCTFLWWASRPGLFNSLCLDVMLVCSLGTLFINGNPLLRYDGYFILADLAEVPNLKTESSAALRRLLARWFLGWGEPRDRALVRGRPRWLPAYAIASMLYRVVIVVLILWALAKVLGPYHLEVLVVPVALATLLGMMWPAIVSAARWVRDPARRRLAPARFAAACGLLALALGAAFLMPLPMRVTAPLVLEYRDAQRVYVTEPGRLVQTSRAGQKVREGDVLAQLSNPAVELELAQLTSQRDRQRLYLANLEARHLQGSIDSAEIPAARAALADVQSRLDARLRDAQRLSLTAPAAGTVLPPPALPPEPPESDTLGRWSGTPLLERNLGALLETGTLVCLVGDPRRFEAILHVDESDVELVVPGQSVAIRLDSLPGETYRGRVVEIARLDVDVMPRELAAAGDVPARTDRHGLSRPLDTWYQARVAIDADPPHGLARVHGRAKIAVAPQTAATRIARYLKKTFGR
jgi:putative peptide zinc metalloprotease protein